jgi:hypothetical protein
MTNVTRAVLSHANSRLTFCEYKLATRPGFARVQRLYQSVSLPILRILYTPINLSLESLYLLIETVSKSVG